MSEKTISEIYSLRDKAECDIDLILNKLNEEVKMKINIIIHSADNDCSIVTEDMVRFEYIKQSFVTSIKLEL